MTALIGSARLTHGLFAHARILQYRGVAEGLAYIHSKGFMHGDIKPENILLTEASVPQICDFDTAVPVGSRTQRVRGTEAYLPPECVEAAAGSAEDGATSVRPDLTAGAGRDVWSFGLVVHMVVTGTAAWAVAASSDARFCAYQDWRISNKADDSIPWDLFQPSLRALITTALERIASRGSMASLLGVLHDAKHVELDIDNFQRDWKAKQVRVRNKKRLLELQARDGKETSRATSGHNSAVLDDDSFLDQAWQAVNDTIASCIIA